MKNNKSGSAIPIVLIFSFLMLVMGLAYGRLTQNSKIQTIQIDERVKLDYAIESMAELALLKYQLYPADYYVCKELEEKGNDTYIKQFLEKGVTGNNVPFWQNDENCKSSFNNKPVHIELIDMKIITTEKWNTEALQVDAFANYNDMFGRDIDKTGTRLYEINRITDTKLIE